MRSTNTIISTIHCSNETKTVSLFMVYMKIEIYFFNITKQNGHFVQEWLLKHKLEITTYYKSFYDCHFETHIMCYQLDELITLRTLNDLNFHIRVIE